MKIIKPILLSIFAVVIAILSSVASFIITSKILKKEPAEVFVDQKITKEIPVSVSAEIDDAEKDIDEKETHGFKHYLVKLEGDKINVYVNYEEHEELLYGEQINIRDLSEEDKSILTEGKSFETMGELVEFTENFTS